MTNLMKIALALALTSFLACRPGRVRRQPERQHSERHRPERHEAERSPAAAARRDSVRAGGAWRDARLHHPPEGQGSGLKQAGVKRSPAPRPFAASC